MNVNYVRRSILFQKKDLRLIKESIMMESEITLTIVKATSGNFFGSFT